MKVLMIVITAIFSCTLMPFTAKAQVVNWDTLLYIQQADFKLAQLNKSLITTNILYDRVMPIADIERFKSQETFSDTSSPRHLVQAYYELYNAAYNKSTWITPDDLDNRLDTNNTEENAIPIGLLYYKYNTLDTNAYVDGLIDTLPNGQLVDKPNRTRSPYFQYTTFIASPIIADNELFEEGEDYTFYLDPSYFFHNSTLTITQIIIDFGDGQGEWVVDNPFTTLYQTRSGFSTILKKLGKVLKGRITVIGFDIAGHWIRYGNPFKILAKTMKDEYPLTPCKGGKGGGRKWVIDPDPVALAQQNAIYGNPPISYKQKVKRVGIFRKRVYIDVKDTAYFFFKDDGNNCANAVVKRPVIFIDGFDPLNDRKIGDIYQNYINKQVNRNGDPNTLFGDYMLNEGYDFVILDFKHGNDLLERNAMTLVALIQRMNATFGANYLQDITLIGPSMGSLIAQYALTFMENKGIPHRVKTYISFDGNHQGANVPIGLQNFVEYITQRGVLKNTKIIREGLYNGYGAKQQLTHHHSAKSQFPAPDAMRTQFLANLTALHPTQYPQNCRKVALINGANNGTLNPQYPDGTNTTILSIDLKRKGWKSIWGLCNDDICKRIKWTARTATNSGTNRVAEMWSASPLFNTLFWLPLGKTNTYAQAAWENSSQDNAPGGLFGDYLSENRETHATFLAKELIYLITGDKPNFNININNFTMMPSYSSADLRFPNKNLYMKWDDQYLCGKTPFDYVYAPPTNEEHVSVSPEASVYFENEVSCNTNSLPTYINPVMTGSGFICNNGQYSIESCLPVNNIAWSALPAGIVSFSGAGSQVTVTKVNSGTVTIFAKITSCNNAYTQTVSKTIIVGTPQPGPINWEWNAPPNRVMLDVDDVPSATSYKWYLDGVLKATTTSSYYPLPMNGNVSCGNFYYFGVKAVNSCGTSPESFIGAEMPPCGFRYTISPNPSSANVNIESNNNADSKANSKKSSEIQEVEIIDKMGVLKQKQKFAKGLTRVNISVNSLPNDIYTLRIFDGQNWHSTKIVVQH